MMLCLSHDLLRMGRLPATPVTHIGFASNLCTLFVKFFELLKAFRKVVPCPMPVMFELGTPPIGPEGRGTIVAKGAYPMKATHHGGGRRQ